MIGHTRAVELCGMQGMLGFDYVTFQKFFTIRNNSSKTTASSGIFCILPYIYLPGYMNTTIQCQCFTRQQHNHKDEINLL